MEITELPIRTWTQNYKESVLEPMLEGNEKQPALIQCVVPILILSNVSGYLIFYDSFDIFSSTFGKLQLF